MTINSSDNQKKTKNMKFSEYHSLELSQKLKADNIGSNGCIKCDATPIIAKIYIYIHTQSILTGQEAPRDLWLETTDQNPY